MGRDLLGYAVHLRGGHAHGLSYVPDRLLGSQGTEGYDLGDVGLPVLFLDVFDDLVAVVDAEVHVDIRHGDPGFVEEPLEDQRVLQRIHLGDAGAVGDEAARAAAAAGAHRDIVILRVFYVVPDDEEVFVEAHLVDDSQLIVEPLAHLVGDDVVLLFQAILRDLSQIGGGGIALRQGVGRDVVMVELELHVAAVRHFLGVLNGLRHV